ncbi:sulfotransferase ssu-1-like [Ornithodoros turicata]|uniref:sulfotransferase ssu-1-like n=1 Tax=Ornithodoros turicata TaxID=34597 RepID=UPI0031392855
MTDTRPVPATHVVNGVRLPIFFDADTARASMTYTPKDTDVFIATYPKCGTTWMQHIVYLIQNHGKPPQKAGDFFRSSTYLEMLGKKAADEVTVPGAIKTHLPFDKVPFSPKAKYIYVYRNPWDCVVSYFNHVKTIPPYKFQGGTFDDLFEAFMRGEVEDGDYFDHFLGWYAHRSDQNVFPVSYEEMHVDPTTAIRRVGQFLGEEYEKSLQDDNVLQEVLKCSSLDYMKVHANEYMRDFFRKDMRDVLEDPALTPSIKNIRRGFSEDDVDSFGLVKKGGIGKAADVLKPDHVLRLRKKLEEKLSGVELPDSWKNLPYLL